MFSESQIKKHLNKKGTTCPDCGDTMISGDSFVVDNGTAYQDMQCYNCGAFWRDVYRLVDVIDG